MPKPSLWDRIQFQIPLPYQVIRTGLETLFLQNERNIFKKGKSVKSVKVSKFGKLVDLKAFL
jgi:hypothetical protein